MFVLQVACELRETWYSEWRNMIEDQPLETAQTQSGTAQELIALLDAKRWEIATSWAEAVRHEVPDLDFAHRPIEEIRETTLLNLKVLQDLFSGSNVLPPFTDP
jgi:hypothetical protein